MKESLNEPQQIYIYETDLVIVYRQLENYIINQCYWKCLRHYVQHQQHLHKIHLAWPTLRHVILCYLNNWIAKATTAIKTKIETLIVTFILLRCTVRRNHPPRTSRID